MEGRYDLMLGREVIGYVTVTQQGLYYDFFCKCRLTGDVIYRVVVRIGETQVSLGVPAPRDGAFWLKTRVARRRFSGGEPVFLALPRHGAEQDFVPLSPEEPFRYLRRLKDAYLIRRNGQLGVGFRDR